MIEAKQPMVSVCMITYNHEAYIAQAIEGVLTQVTSFPIELVIGEDCSSDRTREICLSYQEKNPAIIRVVDRKENLGMSEGFRDTLAQCKGEYIALCEGDDFWTDSSKLEKQVHFMEENQDFTLCFHRAQRVSEKSELDLEFTIGAERDILVFDDVVKMDFGWVPTASCLYRGLALRPFPTVLPPLDWVLLLLASKRGKLRFLNETMSVYRQHEGGWTHELTPSKAENMVNIALACKEYFGSEFGEQFHPMIAHWRADLCFSHFGQRNWQRFMDEFRALETYSGSLGNRTRFALMARKWVAQVLSNFTKVS